MTSSVTTSSSSSVDGACTSAQGLTREALTAAVHYLRWELTPGQIEAFADGTTYLAIDHPAYLEQVELSDTTRSELLADLRS